MDPHAGAKRSRSYEYLIWPDRDRVTFAIAIAETGRAGMVVKRKVRRFMTHSKQGETAKERENNDRETRVSGVPQHV